GAAAASRRSARRRRASGEHLWETVPRGALGRTMPTRRNRPRNSQPARLDDMRRSLVFARCTGAGGNPATLGPTAKRPFTLLSVYLARSFGGSQNQPSRRRALLRSPLR